MIFLAVICAFDLNNNVHVLQHFLHTATFFIQLRFCVVRDIRDIYTH